MQVKAFLHRELMFVSVGNLADSVRKWDSSTAGVGMTKQDDLSYHSERATRELDLGLTAETLSAARAHLKLASMHMERVRELTGTTLSPPLAAVG